MIAFGRRTAVLSFFVAILLLLQLVDPVASQFGIPKKQETEIKSNGQQEGTLSAKDAADMEMLITQARADPATMELVAKLKGELSAELLELRKLPEAEVVGGMKQALDDMKMLDYLFKDPERALLEMEKDGLIEKKHLKKYKKDPALLEADTRESLYMQFISLAVVGGFME